MGWLFILVHYYNRKKDGRVGGGVWAFWGHVNGAYPSRSVSWFLAPVGDQAFNISFCRIFRSDEVVDGLFRFFGV